MDLKGFLINQEVFFLLEVCVDASGKKILSGLVFKNEGKSFQVQKRVGNILVQGLPLLVSLTSENVLSLVDEMDQEPLLSG